MEITQFTTNKNSGMTLVHLTVSKTEIEEMMIKLHIGETAAITTRNHGAIVSLMVEESE